MRLSRSSVSLSLALLALALPIAGCGGGGGGDSTTTITLISRGIIDGVIAADGSFNSTGVFPTVGSTSQIQRGIYCFDLPVALAGKTIDSATLRVDQVSAQANAYTVHGNVVADHINLQGLLALNSTVFAGLILVNDFGTVSTNATLGVKTLGATARVQADVDAARTTSSYRLHFTAEVGTSQGVAIFSDGEGTSAVAQLPQLVVTFH